MKWTNGQDWNINRQSKSMTECKVMSIEGYFTNSNCTYLHSGYVVDFNAYIQLDNSVNP